MTRILCWSVLLAALLPLSAIGQNTDNLENKVSEMIDSRMFLEKDGVEKLQTAAAGLSEDWRWTQYGENKKNRSWGWFSLLIPSSGNWIVGDKVGGVVSVVGTAGSFALYFGGYLMFFSSVYTAGGRTYSVDLTGLYIMAAGVVLMTGFDIYSIVSALTYADGYNKKLKAGLGIGSFDTVGGETGAENGMNQPFKMNLLSYRF